MFKVNTGDMAGHRTLHFRIKKRGNDVLEVSTLYAWKNDNAKQYVYCIKRGSMYNCISYNASATNKQIVSGYA